MHVYPNLLSQDPKTSADEFGIVTVKALSGDVEVELPPYLRKQLAAYGAYSPRLGDKYSEGTIIKTGKDGLIVLESEYKHTITIDSSTQVRVDEL